VNAVIEAASAAVAKGGALVWGHRGARAYAPMNTLPSFDCALKQGADGIELDVQLSADGVPVIMHDFTVDGTTDGKGAVKDLSFAQLRLLDAAARFSASSTPVDGSTIPSYGSVSIPSLQEVLDFASTARGGSFFVNIELKAPYCDEAGLDCPDGLEEAVAEVVRKTGMADRVIISSFNPPSLRRFRELEPSIPLGYLYEADAPVDTRALVKGLDHEAWHPHWKAATTEALEKEGQAGRIVNCWTVNGEDVASRLMDIGVAGIITDRPDLMRDLVDTRIGKA